METTNNEIISPRDRTLRRLLMKRKNNAIDQHLKDMGKFLEENKGGKLSNEEWMKRNTELMDNLHKALSLYNPIEEELRNRPTRPMEITDFGFPSIVGYDDDIKSHSRYNPDYSDVVDSIMGNAETEGLSEDEVDALRNKVEEAVMTRADELKKDRQFDKDDNDDVEVENLKEKYVNSKPARDKNAPGEPYKRYPSFMKKKANDELDSYTKSLQDWLDKNPKGREDIPSRTRR